ncbi:MAG: hypothetical protein A2293_07815 [Elusimicrobia bacterium RIFOXYB2_FULL_49_7]|nr:MAG: hypothetical protein A2293_07815 [Elusimicrobia bacterium RIFOXYB2_FULL_49_7]
MPFGNRFSIILGVTAVAVILCAISFDIIPLILLPFMVLLVPVLIFMPRWLLILFVLSFPFGIPSISMSFNMVLFPADVVLMMLVIALFTAKREPLELPDNRLVKLTYLLFTVFVLSLIVNIPILSFKGLLHGAWYLFMFCKLVFIYWLGVYVGRNPREKRYLQNLFLIVSTIPVFVEIVQVFIIKDPLSIKWGALGTNGQHHSGMGVFLCLPLFMAFGRILEEKRLFSKYTLLLLFYVLGILLSQSRSMLLGIIAIVPLVIYLNWRKFGFKNIVVFLTIIIFFAVVSGQAEKVMSRTLTTKGKEIDYSSLSRLVIWKSAFLTFRDFEWPQKLFGCGIGNITETIRLIFPIDNGSRHPSGGHNNYIHVLIEAGMVGLAVFLAFLSRIVLILWKSVKQNNEVMAFFLLTLVMLLGAIVQEFFWMASWHAYSFGAFLFFLGLLPISTGNRKAS